MKKVNQREFYDALIEAGKAGLDPMPQRRADDWVCQKTRNLFGRVIMKGHPIPKEYYLNVA